MRRVTSIAVIILIIASAVAAGLIWLSMNDNPLNGPYGPADNVFGEAPMLKELVENGTLPPVEERLPNNPMLIQPHDEVGVYGGTWRMGLVGTGSSVIIRTYACYEGLLRWDPMWSRILPNLAQSYDVNEDASEFTFHLREGLRWSDGVNFTADDILFWYEDDLLNEELHSSISSFYKVNDTPVVIEQINNYTVKFSFAESYGLFPFQLADVKTDWVAGRPKHYMKQFHIDYNPEGIDELIEEAGVDTWVQLYNLKANAWRNPDIPTMNAWTLQNWYGGNASFVVMERNPFYWKIDTEFNQLPYIDRINLTIYSSSDELKSAMLNGSIDMQHGLVNIANYYEEFAANMEIGNYSLYRTLSTRDNAFSIQLNLVHEDHVLRSVFSNKTFRIALSHAINRTAIIEEIYDQDLAPRQPAPRDESPYYRDGLVTQYLDFNLTLANELLDSAGYAERDIDDYRLTPSGHRINFTISVTGAETGNYYRASMMLSEYWHDLGIIVNVTTIDAWPLTQLVRANGHDAIVTAAAEGYTALLLNPGNFMPFSQYTSRWAIPWVYWYENNTLGEEPPMYIKEQFQLYEQLKAALEPEDMIQILSQILEIAEDQFYMMGICLNVDGYLLVKSNFHNVPKIMPKSFAFPTPAPTNPCQYYIDPQNLSTLILRAGFVYEDRPDFHLSTTDFDGCCFVTKDQ